jgi:uncharacterized protein YbjT (DUF2867 family)
MEKVFVFGGSGTAGKVLLKHLSEMRVLVVSLTRNLEKAKPCNNVKWIQGNPKDKSTYIEELKGCSVVLNVLGSDDRKKVDIYSIGSKEIISAME